MLQIFIQFHRQTPSWYARHFIFEVLSEKNCPYKLINFVKVVLELLNGNTYYVALEVYLAP